VFNNIDLNFSTLKHLNYFAYFDFGFILGSLSFDSLDLIQYHSGQCNQ